MPRYFFLLSGEHKTLPFAEVRSILEAETITWKERPSLPQVMRLNAPVNAIKLVAVRAALTRICCEELLSCRASFGEIVNAARSTSVDAVLRNGDRFAVRIRHVGEAGQNLDSMNLERKLGGMILNKSRGAKVDLQHPQKTFFGVISEGKFVFGLKLAQISPTPFMQRRPRKRPFFHPSAMPAKLARCMVNLAGPKQNSRVLDPFCGTGSFLIEAGLLGCKVFGIDAQKRMVKGCRRNLKFFKVEFEGVAVAEATHLPLANVDCIVTDPPYGRSASTMGRTTRQIIQGFLEMAGNQMGKGQRMCIASPKTVALGRIARKFGFKTIQSHFVYVHRSLTREIEVLERA